MKALLIKDLKLIQVQRLFVLSVLAIAIVVLLAGNDPLFPIGYFIMLGVMSVFNTLSYDDYENGTAFLLVLPITRQQYVAEKYLLSLLLSGGMALLGMAFSSLAALLKAPDLLPEILSCAGGCLLPAIALLSIMLPLHFQFGAEKARTALVVVGGSLLVIGLFLVKWADRAGVDFSRVFSLVSQFGIPACVAAVSLCVLLLFFCSYRISLSILLSKDF